MSFRSFVIASILLFFGVCAYSQTIERPYVESQYHSQYGSTDVVGVIAKDGYTLILIECITPRNVDGYWIAFSDKTILTFANTTFYIKSWGYWDGQEIQEKEFNQHYTLQSDRRYHFVLAFPQIPSGTKRISVRENISDGFYWNGIHLDATSGDSSSGSHSLGNNDGNRGEDRSRSGFSSSSGDDSFEPVGSGTCFALSRNGYLATCYHVVESASRIKIRGVNGDFSVLYNAKVIATDKRNDLAILKITDQAFTHIDRIPYQVSGTVSDVGEEVFVLGYPLRAVMGDEIKLTNGLISSKTGYQGDVTAYQISATIQPGNSGGPLFDSAGNVIGIVNARLVVESAAYAVKSPYLKMLSESTDNKIVFNTENRLVGKSLKEKVKEINRFVYIIEIE